MVSHRRTNQRPGWLMRSFILNFCSETGGASENWHHTYVSSKRDEVGPAAADGEAVVEFLFKQGFTFLQTNTTFRVPTESEPSHMQGTGVHQACSHGQSWATEQWQWSAQLIKRADGSSPSCPTLGWSRTFGDCLWPDRPRHSIAWPSYRSGLNHTPGPRPSIGSKKVSTFMCLLF